MNVTTAAKIADPATATPAEIDTVLAELYRLEGAAEHRLAALIANLHQALGERARYVTRTRKAWPTTDEQALAAVRAKAEAGESMSSMHSYRPFAEPLAAHEAAVGELDAIRAQAEPLNVEYVHRGGWSRFFLAQSNDGHYHSTMRCQTCNRGASDTQFGWNPEMSGMSEADALAELGRRAAILCSVCFPNAPVEMYGPAADARGENECSGSRKAPKEGKRERWGSKTYAPCAGECHEYQMVTGAGATRKHNKPKAKKK